MSFCAKNASTTTMRIGKAALLKNRLTGLGLPPAQGRNEGRLAGVFCGSARFPPAFFAYSHRLLGGIIKDRDIRELAVALGVVEPVADHEAIGDLEPHVADLDVRLAPLRLGEQRAHLE